ncbi:hypothetical protein MUO71_01740 [Candidatus Bathyarchaeota archaeon]|jgi:capsule polysaccharide export protein KpsE/RkpR|nr:hypothetical protein [Candidatus Bathyarchaeota archaeon]TFH13641.1 MAG: hypothetical protein E4H04_11630 [Candidatus Bathyarchaeota archaeon]
MSEKKVKELGVTLIQKQIDLAKMKKSNGKISEIVNLESEIVNLRREFNLELQKISNEKKTDIDVDE